MNKIAENHCSRREMLAGGLAVALLPYENALAAEMQSLGEIAAAKGLLFGASFAVHELDKVHGTQYAGIYKREARSITSELEFKMDALRPDASSIEFAAADRLVDFARHNYLSVRGHTLIWNDFQPAWINSLGPGEVNHLLEAHIQTVMERYRGRIATWDVVNEPLAPWDKLPGNLRNGPYMRALGKDYIARSFRAARASDPAARLVLNEAQTETGDANGQTFRDSLYALVKELKESNVPVDAIGLQCHLKAGAPYDFAKFADFIQSLASLGYSIDITELDVDDRALKGSKTTRDAAVADLYAKFLAAVLPIKAVKSLTLWQLADHTSWLNTAIKPKRPARPLVYDENFQRKLSWSAVAQALSEMPPR